MAEHSSKSAIGLHRKTLKAAEKGDGRGFGRTGWYAHQVRMMNPRKMSPDDIEMCKLICGKIKSGGTK